MNQRVVYGKDREAIAPYDVAIWWHLAFDVEKSIFNPTYIKMQTIVLTMRKYFIQSPAEKLIER